MVVIVQVMERVPYFLEPLLHLWALELSHDPSSPRRPDDLGRGFDWRTAEPGTKGDSVLEYEFRLAAAETAVVTMPFLNRYVRELMTLIPHFTCPACLRTEFPCCSTGSCTSRTSRQTR